MGFAQRIVSKSCITISTNKKQSQPWLTRTHFFRVRCHVHVFLWILIGSLFVVLLCFWKPIALDSILQSRYFRVAQNFGYFLPTTFLYLRPISVLRFNTAFEISESKINSILHDWLNCLALGLGMACKAVRFIFPFSKYSLFISTRRALPLVTIAYGPYTSHNTWEES